MTATRRLFPFMTLSLGGIGVVVCVAGIFGVWLVGARLNRAVENVFAQIDSSFLAVRDAVVDTGDRVREAKITSVDIEQSLKDWTKKEASERLTSRLGVEEKAARLASGLQQADDWLEFSESSVQIVLQVLELGNSTGAPVETELAGRLLEELASLRVELTEATEFVVRIRERTAEASEEQSLEERIKQAAQFALRVIATLGSIESQLDEFESKISETQEDLQGLKTRTLRWSLVVTIGITFLIAWMAAGQVALCRHGWHMLRQL